LPEDNEARRMEAGLMSRSRSQGSICFYPCIDLSGGIDVPTIKGVPQFVKEL